MGRQYVSTVVKILVFAFMAAGAGGCSKSTLGPTTDTSNQDNQGNNQQQGAPAKPGLIVGFVTLSNASNATGIDITLYKDASVMATMTTTLASGAYEFGNLTLGSYSLAAAKHDYWPAFYVNNALAINGDGHTLSASFSLGSMGFHSDDLYTTGDVVFSRWPMDPSDVDYIFAVGLTSPPGHTFPSDHAYFNFNGSPTARLRRVFAPAPGKVIQILGGTAGGAAPTTYSVLVQATRNMAYSLNHVTPDAAITTGVVLTAGQPVGYQDQVSYGIDLGLVNADAHAPRFITPGRYHYTGLHSTPAFPYFVEPLRSDVRAKILRSGLDKDGRHDYDQVGKLIGNWFHEATPNQISGGEAKGLAFHPFAENPANIMVTLGSSLSLQGRFNALVGLSPDPTTVTVATGKVVYDVVEGGTGRLIVQLLSDNTLKAEAFPNSTTATEFTSSAKLFVR